MVKTKKVSKKKLKRCAAGYGRLLPVGKEVGFDDMGKEGERVPYLQGLTGGTAGVDDETGEADRFRIIVKDGATLNIFKNDVE